MSRRTFAMIGTVGCISIWRQVRRDRDISCAPATRRQSQRILSIEQPYLEDFLVHTFGFGVFFREEISDTKNRQERFYR